MNFDFSDDQKQLRDQARKYLTEKSPPKAVRAVLDGKAPYDKDAFALAASRIAALAPMLPEGFPAGSYVAGKTDAKPELWKDPDEFARLMKDLATRSAALAEIAKSGDLAKIRPAFEDLTKACKACHKKFRAE